MIVDFVKALDCMLNENTEQILQVYGHPKENYYIKNWWPKSRVIQALPFQSLQHRSVGEGATSFPGLLHFTLDPYLILLSVKQGVIKYTFLSFWYDSTCDWNPVSRTAGEYLILKANALLNIKPIIRTPYGVTDFSNIDAGILQKYW